MKNQLVTLRQAAAELGVPTHVVVYALTSGKVEEPMHISGRRMFSRKDIESLRRIIVQKPAGWRRRGNHERA